MIEVHNMVEYDLEEHNMRWHRCKNFEYSLVTNNKFTRQEKDNSDIFSLVYLVFYMFALVSESNDYFVFSKSLTSKLTWSLCSCM